MFSSVSLFGRGRGGRGGQAAPFDVSKCYFVVTPPIMMKMRSVYPPRPRDIGRKLFHNTLLLRFKEAGHALALDLPRRCAA
jgi:hypothetical protein